MMRTRISWVASSASWGCHNIRKESAYIVPESLKGYVGEYRELAPIRDGGLSRYDFFLAGVST